MLSARCSNNSLLTGAALAGIRSLSIGSQVGRDVSNSTNAASLMTDGERRESYEPPLICGKVGEILPLARAEIDRLVRLVLMLTGLG